MKKTASVFWVFVLSIGCSSAPKASSQSYLQLIKTLPIGSTKEQVIEKFGPPTEVEQAEDGGQQFTYLISHNGIKVPKVFFLVRFRAESDQ